MLGQKINALPYNDAPIKPNDAFVSYIHPEYRYYEVTFVYEFGSFREAMFFSPAELEELRNLGLVPEAQCFGGSAAMPYKKTSGGQGRRGRGISKAALEDLEAML